MEMGSECSAPQELQAHMSDMLPQVYLVRHGETAWSVSGQVTGRTDIPLTHRGERDAQVLARQLQGLSFVQVLTSPSQRARRTAVLAGIDECAQLDPDLLEWDYGAYEGRRTAEIQAERPGWRLFEEGYPDRETLQAVSVRADSAAREGNYTAATGVGELLLDWEPTDCRTWRLNPRLRWLSETRMCGNLIDQFTHS